MLKITTLANCQLAAAAFGYTVRKDSSDLAKASNSDNSYTIGGRTNVSSTSGFELHICEDKERNRKSRRLACNTNVGRVSVPFTTREMCEFNPIAKAAVKDASNATNVDAAGPFIGSSIIGSSIGRIFCGQFNSRKCTNLGMQRREEDRICPEGGCSVSACCKPSITTNNLPTCYVPQVAATEPSNPAGSTDVFNNSTNEKGQSIGCSRCLGRNQLQSRSRGARRLQENRIAIVTSTANGLAAGQVAGEVVWNPHGNNNPTEEWLQSNTPLYHTFDNMVGIIIDGGGASCQVHSGEAETILDTKTCHHVTLQLLVRSSSFKQNSQQFLIGRIANENKMKKIQEHEIEYRADRPLGCYVVMHPSRKPLNGWSNEKLEENEVNHLRLNVHPLGISTSDIYRPICARHGAVSLSASDYPSGTWLPYS